jgi:hypothetical protein
LNDGIGGGGRDLDYDVIATVTWEEKRSSWHSKRSFIYKKTKKGRVRTGIGEIERRRDGEIPFVVLLTTGEDKLMREETL